MTAAIASCARCGLAICEDCGSYRRLALHCAGCAAPRPRRRIHRLWGLAAFAPAAIAAALIGLMLYVGPTRHLDPGDFRQVTIRPSEGNAADGPRAPGVQFTYRGR
jgi:hypothetical protein